MKAVRKDTESMVPSEAANVSEEVIKLEKKQVQSASTGKKEPNESFFGILLILALVFFLTAALGYFGLMGYRYFKNLEQEKSIPSIESFASATLEKVEKDAKPTVTEKSAETPVASSATKVVDKKDLEIKVLNGGSAKGVAGSFAEKLKQAGFAKTSVGNSFGTYTGQILYYAKGQEASLEILKGEVVKSYPAVVVKEAVPGDKDTVAAAFVIILGR